MPAEEFVVHNEGGADVEGRSMGLASIASQKVGPLTKGERLNALLGGIVTQELTAPAEHENAKVLPQIEGSVVESLVNRARPMD